MPVELAPDDVREKIISIVSVHKSAEGPLLPILHDVQAEYGHLPQSSIPIIAHALNLTRAEVHGVASFYHDFKTTPGGHHTLKLCRAEACQSMGADALAADIEKHLGIRFGESTDDGALTLEAVYCLGLCACAPAAMLDGKVVGRLDSARLHRVVEEARK